MSTAQIPDFAPPLINGIYEVASHHVGKSVVDVLRECFTTSGKLRRGDYYYDRVHPMIQQHYKQLDTDDQNMIDFEVTQTSLAKEKMNQAEGSIFRKFSLAKDYQRVAKHLFIIVETASRRAAERHLMAQIAEARAARATQPPAFGTSSTHSDPFSDSHETSSLGDVDVGNLDRVEMSIFESTTGGAAFVLDAQNRDGTAQEFASTFPGVPGGWRNEWADTATLSSLDSREPLVLQNLVTT
ncbi:hypothetical protein EI94DRAFT_1739625 [Lactarius quietus]|nr:hypothetical protein EI94DRAFT_1739625 [Lactarius quietus]